MSRYRTFSLVCEEQYSHCTALAETMDEVAASALRELDLIWGDREIQVISIAPTLDRVDVGFTSMHRVGVMITYILSKHETSN